MGPGQKKIEALEKKMLTLGIRREDIEERFIKSSGKGGQNVNKVSTCVQLRHIPTGTMVKYGTKRSQNLNRFLGLRLLVEKIEETIHGNDRKKDTINKIRRQKKRRQRRSKSAIAKTL